LREQSVNYKLSFRCKQLTQKARHYTSKIKLLEEKLQFLTSGFENQIKEHSFVANNAELQLSKIESEIRKKKNELQRQQSELEAIQGQNRDFKAMGYERKISELSRQLQNIEKQRTEFQFKLENVHHASSCKLQLFLTDINKNSDKTQRDLTQIQDLLTSLAAAGEKQASLLADRQLLQL
jgi:chromosome segregation ATPase